MAYELTYTREAERGLAALPKADARRIVAKLEAVATDPLNVAGVRKLTGRDGYRVRSGDWRALFLLDHGRLVVTVIKVEKRGSVYR
ncbi:MAG: type II toxin-antitoxin system RelE/ParE family toxin [Phenylobacterium sp.]|nr:type II toxin-antitoxin system RelE/ParE family toxin [Phenylobacterium sp.]MBP9756961.1 type II toxin-antitoxin system RelE/ParE family toxin [Phenylobacterium sp.]